VTTAAEASLPIAATDTGAILAVTVVPRAAKTTIERRADGEIRVRVAAPPVDGAANTALLRFLAEALALPRSRFAIASGAGSRKKRVAIDGVSVADVSARMRQALGA
jgi:uncharacterized protein (TIGR00251 family)